MKSFPSYTFKWRSPDGQVYINIIESDPITITINIGKAGTSVSSWAYALAELINLALENKTIDDLIDKLTGITTQQSIVTNGVACRSTAEAVSFAFTEYQRIKRKEKKKDELRKVPSTD